MPAERLAARLAPLRIPGYRRFWTARVLSVTGTSMAPVALAFAVLRLGGSAADLSLVLIMNVSSQILFVLLGGALADRLPRGRVLVLGNLAAGCVQAGVAALVLSGAARIGELAGLAFLGGTASAFIGPAAQGAVSRIVPPELLRDANVLLRTAFNTFKVAGPALGGIVVAALGAGWAIAWDSVTFLAAALIMTGLPAEPVRAVGTRLAADLKAGAREFWARPWLRILVSGGAVGTFAWLVGFQLLGPVYADRSHGGSVAWGEIAAGFAGGLLAGSLGALVWRPRRVAFVMSAAGLLMALPLLAMGLAAPRPVIVLCAAATGFGLDMSILAWSTYRQQAVPDELLARMNAFNTLVQLLPVPLGYAAAGTLADSFGVRSVLFAAAGIAAASALVPLGWREVRMLELDYGPAGDAAAVPSVPASRAMSSAMPSSGPVVPTDRNQSHSSSA